MSSFFRGKFLLRKHIWDIAKCPYFRVSFKRGSTVFSIRQSVQYPVTLDGLMNRHFTCRTMTVCTCTVYWMGSHPISLDIALVFLVFGSSFRLTQILHRLVGRLARYWTAAHPIGYTVQITRKVTNSGV